MATDSNKEKDKLIDEALNLLSENGYNCTKKGKPTIKSKQRDLKIAKSLLEKANFEVNKPNTFRCIKCRGEKSTKEISNWYQSQNDMLFPNIPVIPWCRKCMDEMWKNFVIDSKGDEKLGTYRLFQEIRIPWNEALWDMAESSNRGTKWGMYIAKFNSLPQYKDLKMGDSEPYSDIYESFNLDSEVEISSKISKKKLLEFQDKYGYGFDNEEYLNFERKYNKMSSGYKEKTSLHTERLITYIIHKVKEEMATARGDVSEAEKWGRMATSDADKAKLNVSQLSKSDLTGGIDLVPQLIEEIEERASLIPLMPKIKTIPYDDVDMIIYALTNYNRRLAELPVVKYSDVWGFYDEMIDEHFLDQGYTKEEIEEIKNKRNLGFKDLGEQYTEPLYLEHHQEGVEDEE